MKPTKSPERIKKKAISSPSNPYKNIINAKTVLLLIIKDPETYKEHLEEHQETSETPRSTERNLGNSQNKRFPRTSE